MRRQTSPKDKEELCEVFEENMHQVGYVSPKMLAFYMQRRREKVTEDHTYGHVNCPGCLAATPIKGPIN